MVSNVVSVFFNFTGTETALTGAELVSIVTLSYLIALTFHDDDIVCSC